MDLWHYNVKINLRDGDVLADCHLFVDGEVQSLDWVDLAVQEQEVF